MPPAAEAFERCTGPSVAYQRVTLRIFEANALLTLGDLPRLRAAFDECSRGMIGGNLHAAVTLPLLSRAHQIDLADDRPGDACGRVQAAIGMWSRNGVHLQHIWAWWNETEILLYEWRGAGAWAHCFACWPRLIHPSLLDGMTYSFALWTRGRAAVAFAAELGENRSSERRSVLREATRAARALERLRVPYFAAAMGWSIRAAVGQLQGDRAGAIRELERAEQGYTRWGLSLHVAAVRYRRGQVLGGPAGAELVAAAEKELRVRGVSNPARFVEVYAPGFPVGPARRFGGPSCRGSA